MISDPDVLSLLYLVTIVCFIVALKFLASPRHARKGNWVGGAGMLVAIVTTRADRTYVPGNNDRLRALPTTYPNVRLVDWADAAAACPGSCFYDDGIHLRPDGRTYFAQLITGALA